MNDTPRVLILGGYGLIGAGVMRVLRQNGVTVVGFGRSKTSAYRADPDGEWRFGDLRHIKTPEDWSGYLRGVDYVVNAAGALQDGPEDDLQSVHFTAVKALAQACRAQDIALVQISAIGAEHTASTSFMRSKAQGDDAVRSAGGRHWILRPGLVIARTGYGGTALLRMLSAVPIVQPIALPDVPIQSIGLDDLAQAVRACLGGQIKAGFCADLVEPEAHRLESVIVQMRAWLGFAAPKKTLKAPRWSVSMVGVIADGLGRLGWRSPLRSNALLTLQDGVTGDPAVWAAAGGNAIRPLEQILQEMPARREDRIAARMDLLMPVCVGTLAVFWVFSGLIGLARIDAAAQTLVQVGWSHSLALASVGFWALVDIALGVGILRRRYARKTCIAMIAVCVIYLASASAVTPFLWLDPLGPLLKILPALILCLTTLALLEDR
ncbi:MAG: SDR family oxidoreductase [Planktotalea sp.]|uniref:SDR family oxidoreductase n=1 Tax=Planktotalea sp. TaxID=2029877 RepID=UPI003C7318CA